VTAYNPEKHHRHSIRLPGYDYSQSGAYFVTVCTQNRTCWFGTIINGEMKMNDAGRMIEKWYLEIANKFADIKPGEYIVMPNHFHAIIVNATPVVPVGADLCVCPDIGMGEHHHEQGEHAGSPLHRVVQWFKTMTTNEYIRNVKNNGWTPFEKRLWQRNYYEHIIRDDGEYLRIAEYIANNPMNWRNDKLWTN
jgi:REP element-mobilizing transposase RayT